VSLRARLERVEARAGKGAGPIVIVFQDADGGWRDARGEPIEGRDVPPDALVIAVVRRPDGPQ